MSKKEEHNEKIGLSINSSGFLIRMLSKVPSFGK
jgi:hypothetical protein